MPGRSPHLSYTPRGTLQVAREPDRCLETLDRPSLHTSSSQALGVPPGRPALPLGRGRQHAPSISGMGINTTHLDRNASFIWGIYPSMSLHEHSLSQSFLLQSNHGSVRPVKQDGASVHPPVKSREQTCEPGCVVLPVNRRVFPRTFQRWKG